MFTKRYIWWYFIQIYYVLLQDVPMFQTNFWISFFRWRLTMFQGDWSPTGNSHITFACLGKWWMGKWWCTILRFDRKVFKKKKNDAFLRCVDGSYNPCIETCPKFAMFCSTIFADEDDPNWLICFKGGLKPPMRKLFVTWQQWPPIVAFWVAPSDPKWKRGSRFEHVKSSQETVPIPEINGLV